MNEQWFILISPYESNTHDWELKGPYNSVNEVVHVCEVRDYTKEYYIITAKEIASMCRKFTCEDGYFTPPNYEEM